MTSLTPTESHDKTGVDENKVIRFLRANLGFLDEHPDLLRDLWISHSTGSAVSLLERQVTLLRDENSRVKRQIEELMNFARENEVLTRKIHDLTLTLITAVNPRTIFLSLNRSFVEDFSADQVFCFVFADAVSFDHDEVSEFVGAGAAIRVAFSGVIEERNAKCGPLSKEQRVTLFEDENHEGSAVVMPLNGNGWDGVVIVSSEDSEKYQAYMGTEFLTYLSNVISLALDSWVELPGID